MTGARHVPAERRTVAAFAEAWQRGDHRAMYALLSDDAKKRTSLARLQRSYAQAAQIITLQRVAAGAMTDDRTFPVTFQTRIFGTLKGTVTLPLGERKEGGPGVDWHAELVYPGLHRGEKLRRETTLPERATIQARDGTALAKGPDRLSDLGPLAARSSGTSARPRPSAPRSSPRAAFRTVRRSA